MRLVCPNCDAQYEVADDAIPAEGRDVQCSACGTVWFQNSPAVLAAKAAEAALFDGPAPVDAGLHDAPIHTAPGLIVDAPDLPAEDDPLDVAPDEDLPASPDSAAAPRRSLDESLLAVLREEAEREAEARRAETPRGIEIQPDLGLDDAPPLQRPGRSRDVFPDIEEINSTLRPSAEHDGLGPEAASEPILSANGGFRRGFMVMVALGILVLSLYLSAPRLAEQVPALAPVLDGFTHVVDGLRVALDGWMKQATSALQGG